MKNEEFAAAVLMLLKIALAELCGADIISLTFF